MSEDGVETPGEFAQFAVDAGIVDWLTETAPGEDVPETPELPVDTGSAVERPRDEQGRFMSTKVDEEVPEEDPEGQPEGTPEAEVVAEEQPVESDEEYLEIDDELATILDKYDGDVGKALRALGQSQSMIGRQANEVGELRAQLQELQQAMQQGFQQVQQAPQFLGPYRNDIDENPSGLAMEALERGDGHTLELALRSWGEEDPFAASAFLFSLQQQAAQAAPAAPVAPQQPTAPTTPQGPSLEDAMADVVQRHPDVEKYLPQVQQVAQEFPTLRDSMRDGSPQLQAQAFEELLKIAKSRSSEGDTAAAVRRVMLKTQEEVREEKANAAVVSAKTQSAAKAGSGVDQFQEAFAELTGQHLSGDWIERSNQ